MKPRLLDLFSGIAGFSLAFERHGFRTVAFSEIEPFPCRVLAHHWPTVLNLGDVRGIDGTEVRRQFGNIDVVTFGSPCQDMSVAGKRAGLTGERSSLFHEAIRIIRDVRPAFALWENVPGAFSSNGGWDFAAVLDSLAECGALDIAWRVLDAQYAGVPQRRDRIFVVADFRGERAGEILALTEGVSGHPAPRRAPREDVAGSLTTGSGGGRYNKSPLTFNNTGHGWWNESGDLASPIRTPDGGGSLEANVVVANGLTRRYGKGTDSDATDTLITLQPNDPGSHNGATTPALRGGDNGGCHGSRAVIAHALRAEGFDASEDGTGRGTPLVPVAFNWQDSGHNFRSSSSSNPLRANQTEAVQQSMMVRRLTPVECARLQAFPDDWLDLPGAADGPKYRALGNAVCVAVVEQIAERMARVIREQRSAAA